MHWTDTFFDADYERIAFPWFTEERTRQETDFIEAQLCVSESTRILDAGCGNGRHAIGLAERGHRVTGIDRSPRMIGLALENARRKPVQAEFAVQDIRQFDLSACFDAAFCYFTTFGYFSDDENRRILQNMARALVPSGHLLLETMNRDWIVNGIKVHPRIWHEIEPEFFLLESRRYETSAARVFTRWIILDHGQHREKQFDLRVYSLGELEDMFESVGLQPTGSFGGADASPHSLNSPRTVLVGVKT